MSRRMHIVLLALAALLLLAMASNRMTLYLPLVSRMPPPAPSLSGRVFFDYNGSGLQEQGEPGIPGFPVWIDSIGSALHATTSQDGSYSILNVPLGSHQVYVQSPTQDPATAFRYINLFKGWVDIPAYEMHGVSMPFQHLPDTEIQPVDRPLNVTVNGYTRWDVALTQGLLSFPVAEGYPAFILGYFDLDGVEQAVPNGSAIAYNGNRFFWPHGNWNAPVNSSEIDPLALDFPGVSGVQDSHPATDVRVDLLTPLVSPAPGTVSRIYWENGQNIKIVHDEVAGQSYRSFFGHLAVHVPVSVGQRVYRGQIVALSGDTGEGNFGVDLFDWSFTLHPERTNGGLDPFRNTTGVQYPFGSAYSWWTKDNSPRRAIRGFQSAPHLK